MLTISAREWYRITPNTDLLDPWTIENLRENIHECMLQFQDPNTELGASQTYPRISKHLSGTQQVAYMTWKLWLKEIMDHCNCGPAPPVGSVKKSQVPQFASSQQVFDDIGIEEDVPVNELVNGDEEDENEVKPMDEEVDEKNKADIFMATLNANNSYRDSTKVVYDPQALKHLRQQQEAHAELAAEIGPDKLKELLSMRYSKT